MNNGIWKIGRAALCPDCRTQMSKDYVMRQIGDYRTGACERCRKATSVAVNLYTMKGRALRERGLENGGPHGKS